MASAGAKVLAAVVAAGLIGIGGWHYATRWAPAAARYPLQGIDLDTVPEAAEWGTVRARGADFVYLVATAGTGQRTPEFGAAWDALPGAGLRRGAVHLYSLCRPGAAQANAFNTFVPRTADALPAAVDVSFREDCAARPEAAALVGELRRFVATVEAHTGRAMLLRVSRAVEDRYRLSGAIDRPVWTMANFMRADYAARPWRMWRANDLRRIEGIDRPVNWDVVAP